MSMILIQRQVLLSSAASVTFSNIPQNYKTLKILYTTRADTNDQNLFLRPNGSSSSLSSRYLFGNGSSASSGAFTDVELFPGSPVQTANTFTSAEMTIPNYTSSQFKVVSFDNVRENNATASLQILSAGLWSNTAAITSLTFQMGGSANLVSGSSFSLYGLL